MRPLFSFPAVLFAAAVGTAPPPELPAPASPYEGPAVSAPANRIDALVFGRLKALKIQPARLCSDSVFVRRAYLDVIGTLPTPDETGRFLKDENPGKRSALIDRLLQRDEFADYWAMKWSDLLKVKAEFPVNLWPNAAQAYHHWIRDEIKANVPYDVFVRELLTSSGSNFRVPPVNFYRAVQNREPATLARAAALAFMGTRAEKWPAERQDAMAAFFSHIGFKYTQEWKEEIVYWDTEKVAPAAAVFPDGKPAKPAPGRDPREAFADWLITPKNPWFTDAISNRVWSWLMGRGIVQEPDDIRPDNPPVNPELLALLDRELIASRYNLKHLFRIILNSQAYQLASLPASDRPEAAANFAFYPVRRLDAEVLIDALNALTGTTESYSSAIPEPFTFVPEEERSIALPDGSITSSFLEMFGHAQRATGLESERNNHPSATQELYLLNSSHIRQKIQQSPKLQALLRAQGGARTAADGLYLAILSRLPTEEERNTVAAYAASGIASRRDASLDVAWALINSAEFLYRH